MDASVRLADSGFGIIMHSLVQMLLSLKVRPPNPVEWILRRLRDAEFFMDETSMEAFLRNAVRTSAFRTERSPSFESQQPFGGSRRPTLSAQLVVSLLCDLSSHYTLLKDGVIMDESMLMTFSNLISDFAMWEEINASPVIYQKNASQGGEAAVINRPQQIKDGLLLSDYVRFAGSALRLVHALRSLSTPLRQFEQDLSIFDAVFDLAEVLLKLRCFAAQSEVDTFGDKAVPFPSGEALGLSMASQRPFSLTFVKPVVPSLDGMVPVAQETVVGAIERLFHLVRQLVVSAGFPHVTVHCVVTDLPHYSTTKRHFSQVQVRTEPPLPHVLASALSPMDYLENALVRGHSSTVSFSNVTIVRSPFVFDKSAASTATIDGSADPSINESITSDGAGCSCTGRLCRALDAACSSANSDEKTSSSIAPPCVVVLPIEGYCSVLSAPMLVVVGMSMAEHIGKAMQFAVPTYQPVVVAPTPASISAEELSKKKKSEKKLDKKNASDASDGKQQQQQQQPAAANASIDESSSMAASVGSAQLPSRASLFGDAYDMLFPSSSAFNVSDSGNAATDPSVVVVLLKPSSTAERTPFQISVAALLSLALADNLHLGSHFKPQLHVSLPLVGAVAFSWVPPFSKHAFEECWWKCAATRPIGPAETDTLLRIFDAPLVRCCHLLLNQVQKPPIVKFAAATCNRYSIDSSEVKRASDGETTETSATTAPASSSGQTGQSDILLAAQVVTSAIACFSPSIPPPLPTPTPSSPSNGTDKTATSTKTPLSTSAKHELMNKQAANPLWGAQLLKTLQLMRADTTLKEMVLALPRL